MLSLAEENYLKTILKLQTSGLGASGLGESPELYQSASTNHIAEQLQTRAGSVSEMLKKLADKDMVHYQPYQGVFLTANGRSNALQVIRRHRLWETFLVEKLGFEWDKVHDLAEELEHIRSEELIDKLDQYLNHPAFDPHGDPIPNSEGAINLRKHRLLSNVKVNEPVVFCGVLDHDPDFLRYLVSKQIKIGSSILITERIAFDGSCQIQVDAEPPAYISQKVAENLLVV